MGVNMSFKKWLARYVFDGMDELDNDNANEECTCDECCQEKTQQIGYPGMSQAEAEKLAMESWEPPARYCIRAAGMDYWVDSWKSGPGGFGIDIMWTQKIKGEEKTITGTIFDGSFTIIDYASPMTPETFEHIKKQNYDYMMQIAQDAKHTEDAAKEKSTVQSSKVINDVNFASYS
jgi:hypothetical protein